MGKVFLHATSKLNVLSHPDKNVFFSAYLPITGASAYDNTGSPYRASNIIQNGRFDPELYKAYSPPYIPITFVMAYAAAFASMTAIIVHTFCKFQSLSL